MAAITDKLLSVGKRGTVTTLDAPGKPIGASSLKLTSAINWPTDSAVTFSIRRIHLSGENKGKEVAGSYTEWIGVLDPSSRSIDQLKLTYGEDQDYSTGQDVQVAIRVSTTWVELLLAGLRSFLNNDGTFKQGAINAAAIADNAVEAKHIAAKAVTADKIDFASLLLSYKERSAQIHIHGTTPKPVPDLTSKVTIPKGVTKVKVQAYSPVLYNEKSLAAAFMSIWEGEVGTGTRIQEARSFQAGGSGTGSPTATRIVTVTPGEEVTFNVSLHSGESSWVKSEPTEQMPMYLLVEAVG